MALIIAQGVPKSGSTFLYQVAKEIAETINGFSHYEAKKRFFPGQTIPDFFPEPNDAVINGLLSQVPSAAPFVIKTHGQITPLLAERIASGQIKAVMSFRDPRDTAISMIDAGASDRAKGRDRFFTKLREVDDTVGPAKHGWKVAREWFDCRNLLLIPYYMTATNQRWVVDRLCKHLGAAHARYTINAKFAHGKDAKITEFHKGIADRFLDDLTPPQIMQLSKVLAKEIEEADQLTYQCMAAYGFRMMYHYLRDARRERLAELEH